MNLRLLSVSLALTLVSLIGSAQEKRRYTINVNDFSELRIDNDIPVDYYCNPDSAGIAVLFTTPKKADWILFNNNSKGRLTITSDADYPYGETLPHVIVYSSKLEKIVNGGDSLVKVHDIVPVERFRATLLGNGRLVVHDIAATKVSGSIDSGNGQLILSGSCTEASLRNVGTGTIQADDLTAVKVKASIVGTGAIGCNPTEQLTVMGVGSGQVFYRFTPPTIKNRGVGIKCTPL